VTQPVKPKQVVLFTDKKGKQPFAEWVYGLKEVIHRQRIISRIRRLEQGNFGDCKVVGGGVRELRLFFGVGYRVYFGEDRDNIVVLLTGGDKGSQQKDIEQAKAYWLEYVAQNKEIQ
jgi:putative addiction module killer protein